MLQFPEDKMIKLLSALRLKIKLSILFVVLLLPAILAASCAKPSTPPSAAPQQVDWLNIQLKDVLTGKPFKLSDFQGKVVLLETMAVWCTTCRRQQIEIKNAHPQFGQEVVSVSLDIDPNEDEAILKKHAQTNSFNWIWAVSPPLLSRELETRFGPTILNPPATPILIIDRKQSAHLLKLGVKSTKELVSEIAKYR